MDNDQLTTTPVNLTILGAADLRVFEIDVDGDNPRWATINPADYTWCVDADVKNFPVKPGRRALRYVLLPGFLVGHQPFGTSVLSKFRERGLIPPDRAEAETIITTTQISLVALCGRVHITPWHSAHLGHIKYWAGNNYYGTGKGLHVFGSERDRNWQDEDLFLAVIP